MSKSEFKDLFSKQADTYAKFRPIYPKKLYEYLSSLVKEHQLAWDVGTGNGQAAVELANFFDRVVATDPSEKQISCAAPHPKVEYRLGSAEKSSFLNQSLDLVSVAQAFHWFKQDAFFAEVKRTLKPTGVLALWCYELAKITPEIDAVVYQLYKPVLGNYWEKERKLVEEGYQNVVLPFQEIKAPKFEMTATWSLEHLIGYLGTWSALQTFIKTEGHNPLEPLYAEFKKAWGETTLLPVRWELGLRLGQT